ncbi:GspH/FimT family pseudopilin [Endozoicomonas sp. Mp262]|uniref:GspH/FimT family pseudopilin n=1 Tax=Endozoicomonas sp. Mp262 TaxID=2919499 RepID=UPI0021DB63A9
MKMMKVSFRGFSLPELAATLAIAVILAVIAVPSMKSMLADRRIAALTHQLYGSIQLARSEAINRGYPVSLCRTVDSTTGQCIDEGEDWASGWLVFVDNDSDGRLDEGDDPIRVYGQQPADVQIVWNRGHYLRFDSRGQARDAGTFTLCETLADSVAARSISISMTGRARVSDLDSC